MKVKVMELKNKQKLLTIPCEIVRSWNLQKGDVLSFSYIHKLGKIVGLKIEKEE